MVSTLAPVSALRRPIVKSLSFKACSCSDYRSYATAMSEDTTPRRAGSLLAGGGVLAGFGALLGASCCVLPILLVQAGLSTALVAHLAWFAQAKPYLMGVTSVLILAGFGAAFWGGRRPRPLVIALLVGAALLIAAATAAPHYERELLDWIRGR